MQPINTLLEDANALLDKLNARLLLGRLYAQLNVMEGTLNKLAPGDLLKPLEEPFPTVSATLNRLDRVAWMAPLNALYDEINHVIDLINIVPVLTDLDRKQRELLTSVRNTILSAYDLVELPEPLKSFFADMHPVLELITEAIFGDPDTPLKQHSLPIRDQVNLETLSEPLDAAFLRLMRMVETVPAADLTAAMNTIRFLHQLKPLENTIEPAIDEFFGAARQVMLLINPLALRGDVEAIYVVIRAKARILNPEHLATAISTLFDPVKQGLLAFDLATIKAQLDTTANNVVHAVTVTAKQILDELVDIIDTQLRTLRAALKAVLDQFKAAMTSALDSLKAILQQLEDLVCVEFLDRLGRVIDNLGSSFDKELDRVANAFDEMLTPIPLDGGRSESVGTALL